jgi:hypothetical protein
MVLGCGVKTLFPESPLKIVARVLAAFLCVVHTFVEAH